MCIEQVVILERRNGAGKILYKPVLGGWNGSKEEKHKLLEELERLQKDPSILNCDAVLPELNNELTSVSFSGFAFHGVSLIGKSALAYMPFSVELRIVFYGQIVNNILYICLLLDVFNKMDLHSI